MKVKTKKKRSFKLIHLIILVFVIYFGVTVFKQMGMVNELKAEKRARAQNIEELRGEIDYMQDIIERAGTLQFIEWVAREEYGMVKPREKVYVDKDKKKNPFDSTAVIEGNND